MLGAIKGVEHVEIEGVMSNGGGDDPGINTVDQTEESSAKISC